MEEVNTMKVYVMFRRVWRWRIIPVVVILGLVQTLAFGQTMNSEVENSFFSSPTGTLIDSHRTFQAPKGFAPRAGLHLALAAKSLLPRQKAPDSLRKSLDEQAKKGEIQYTQGQQEAVLQTWLAILRIDPAHRRTLFDVATAQMNARQFIKAEKTYEILIQVDSPIRIYPEAWFLAALAHHRQYQSLTAVHEGYLTRYLKSDNSTYLDSAHKLLRIVRHPTVSIPLDGPLKDELLHKLADSERSIIHFWAEWCGPCLKELSDLFEFSRKHPDVNTVIVAEESEKEWADRQLNEIYAPFKESHSGNLVFVFDGKRELWNRFVPQHDGSLLTVPRTVFFEGLTRVGYIASALDWSQVDPASTWSQSK